MKIEIEMDRNTEKFFKQLSYRYLDHFITLIDSKWFWIF